VARSSWVRPAAWAALKLLLDGGTDDPPPTMPPDVATFLRANATSRALGETHRVLRILVTADDHDNAYSKYDRIRDVRSAALANANRALSALLLPLTKSATNAVRAAILVRKVNA